jgi:hypothetical protein
MPTDPDTLLTLCAVVEASVAATDAWEHALADGTWEGAEAGDDVTVDVLTDATNALAAALTRLRGMA